GRAAGSRWGIPFVSRSHAWTFPRESAIWPSRFRRGDTVAAIAEDCDVAKEGWARDRAPAQHSRGCQPEHESGRAAAELPSHQDRDREPEHRGERRVLRLSALPGAALQGGADDHPPAPGAAEVVERPESATAAQMRWDRGALSALRRQGAASGLRAGLQLR